MSNIDTLREHLFATLQGVKDGSINIEKAKVIGDISQVLINTAKVECDFIKANGGGNSVFFNTDTNKKISNTMTGLKVIEGNVTTHKMRG